MAKKYRTNVNGAPVLNVNFNGAPWTGNLKINGIEVSYDDTPAPQPEPPKPQPDTVWAINLEVTHVGGVEVTHPVNGRSSVPAHADASNPLNAPSIFGEVPVSYVPGLRERAIFGIQFQLDSSGSNIRVATSQQGYFPSSVGYPGAVSSEWIGLRAKNLPLTGGA